MSKLSMGEIKSSESRRHALQRAIECGWNMSHRETVAESDESIRAYFTMENFVACFEVCNHSKTELDDMAMAVIGWKNDPESYGE